ncbi:MAG: type VI secretion system tube protein Hcp [Planctomycetes bacterium]|nr:type VI secretion system tube protein Hcp [Planctomycetota bacterium]
MAIYAQIEGIEGPVTETNHAKWIQLHSFSFGVARPIVTEPGRVADRSNSKPTLSEISVSKTYDAASPKLFSWSTVGVGKKVVVHFTKEDGSNFIEVTMESVIPSSYSIGGGADGEPSESMMLNYTKIEIKRIPYDENNKKGTPVPVGYDLQTMKAS